VTLVTGATGFVGRAVLERVAGDGACRLRAVARRPVQAIRGVDVVNVGDLGPKTDWSTALSGVDAVVHAAARVHVIRDKAVDPLAEFRRVNVSGTLNLAKQAAAAGVQRFIFLSSIKVNGEQTSVGRSYTSDDTPAPAGPYGISKYEAELGLRELAQVTGMDVVIIRPVLVYGPGVKGNFRSMMRWLNMGIPLPLGSIHNARSLVALENLVDLVATCLRHPAAANRTFMVSDGEDTSTTELLQRVAAALGTSARLLPVPGWMLQTAASALGMGDVALRLCASLQVDIGKTREVLGWVPKVGLDEALQRTAQNFMAGLQ